MKGRIYDPNLGRFLQADPHVQAPTNSQNYNRYSYVLNNPMSYTDPSGYFFKKLGKFVKKHWRTIAAIVVTVYLGPAATAFFGSTIAGGAAAGFVAGGIATGSLRGALVGALSGAMFGALHNMTAGVGKVVAHGAAGGISSVLNGGKFGHGFLSAGFTQALGNVKGIFTKAPQGMARISNAVKAAVIGGTISKISGGKFSNGAMTGAFSRLLNDDAVTKESAKDDETLASPEEGEEGAVTTEGSKMTKNKDGHWQYRDNAAFAAAGLGESTSTHSCSTLGVHACATIGTVGGAGDSTVAEVADISAQSLETLSEVTSKVKPWYADVAEYFISMPARYESNLQVCQATCGQEAFVREK